MLTFAPQTERDTIEVIAHMRREDTEKGAELEHMRQRLKDLRAEASRERDFLTKEHLERVAQLEASLHDKEEEVRMEYW